MCQPKKWWTGLLPLLALWLGLNRMETERIESELVGRADSALARVVGEPGVSIGAGRDILLNGQIFDEATRPAAVAAVEASPGVRLVKDGLATPPAANPYLWRAYFDGGALTMSGAAPSPAARAAIVAAAQQAFPQAKIADQMTYFTGAPADFAAHAAGVFSILSHLASGSAQLSGLDLTVSGQAASAAEAEAAKALAKQADGLKLVSADVAAPKPAATPDVSPYVLGAQKTEGALLLTGFYPDDAAHAKLLARAKEKLPGLALTDQMKRGSGAPKSFVDAGLAGLDQLARLKAGTFSLRDSAASLSGDAIQADVADDVKTGFVAGLPGGYAVDVHLTGAAREPAPAPAPVAPPAETAAAPAPEPAATSPAPAATPLDAQSCQADLMDLVRKSPIQFESGSAGLLPESTATLDALAREAQRCPDAGFEVSGHTDDVGRVSRNVDLSRRRAAAVVDYLVKAGVAAARLTFEGYGESRPLVPNDSDENRARNRRIEFNLK